MTIDNKNISDELLAAYIDGNTNAFENQAIEDCFINDPELFDDFILMSQAANLVDDPVDSYVETSQSLSPLVAGIGVAGIANLFKTTGGVPMVAASENNLSDDDSFVPSQGSINLFNHFNSNTMSEINIYGDMNPIQQQYSDTCAIKSQQLILNDFGVDVTEDQLVQYSIDKGLYDGNGTQMQDVGRLLADAGIPVVQMDNANVYTLVSELAQGHKVIVGVDADELWSKGVMTSAKDLLEGGTPNHALIVSGIDTTDPNNVKVLLTDPGTGELCKEYPLDQFMDAWQDSSCFMVSTQVPAPLVYNPEMINFNYSVGHIPSIGNMSYEQFSHDFMNVSFDTSSAFTLHADSPFTDYNPDFGLAGDTFGWDPHTSLFDHQSADSNFEQNDASGDSSDFESATDIDFLT